MNTRDKVTTFMVAELKKIYPDWPVVLANQNFPKLPEQYLLVNLLAERNIGNQERWDTENEEIAIAGSCEATFNVQAFGTGAIDTLGQLGQNLERPSIVDEFFVANIAVNDVADVQDLTDLLDDTTWHFLFETLGRKKCSIVDTYWQTEMGSIIATSVPGHNFMKPGFVGHPLFGTELVLLDPETKAVLASTSNPKSPVQDALLCIATPWPGLANDCLSGHEKFVSTYMIPGTKYFSTGDLAAIAEDGYLKITGRTDDQLCVNGHRVGPAEVEAVIIEHPKVREAAVVGIPHPISGQAIAAFAVTDDKDPELVNEIKLLVSSKFSAIGRPSFVYLVSDLPKTRSEKIIRMLLRGILTGTKVKDPPTLKNPQAVEEIRAVVAAKA